MYKLTLTEIWIYPIKSLPGVRVSAGTVLQKGMRGDRRFMLIDAGNRFITQRNFPQLSQFDLVLKGNDVLVRKRHSDSPDQLTISGDPYNKDTFQSVIWDDVVEVMEVSSSHSQWFSDALNVNCKLVYFPEPNGRRVDSNYVAEEHHVSLADGYPYLIIGRSSVRDLSNRVGRDIVMNRFRPNLVFEGGEPYEEDTWRNFKVGSVQFRGVKPCARCPIPTIDPETGIKGDEPLKTLATYRKVNGEVYFGQNVIANNNGEINEGDEIVLL